MMEQVLMQWGVKKAHPGVQQIGVPPTSGQPEYVTAWTGGCCMRPLRDMDTIQIEITNACPNRCSNCTRLVGHHKSPYMMNFDYFKRALQSLIDFPKMIGVMGGEPLLHPEFSLICAYIRDNLPRNRVGLWTSLPSGYEHLREDICSTFGHIFINDHTRGDVLHTPLLVSLDKIFVDERDMWYTVRSLLGSELHGVQLSILREHTSVR